MIKSLTDYTDIVMKHYNSGTTKGFDVGFKCLQNLITLKPGYTTYFLGYPSAGKTEIHLEILFNLTEKYGWKHALLSPEIGGVEDVVGELVSKYLKRPFYKSNPYAADEKKIYDTLAHLSQYFYPIDNDTNDYNVETFYEAVEKLEKEQKIKINTTSVDPWNDLDEDLISHGGREDKYLTWALKKVRQDAKKNNRHNFIVTHAKDSQPIQLKSVKGKDIKVVCTAIPTLNSFAGGQVWSRRAFNVVGMWRAEAGAINPETKMPFEENEALFLSLKSKPKGVGAKGRASLFFDWKTNRYYEKISGLNKYAFEHETMEQIITNPYNVLEPVNHHAFILEAKLAQQEDEQISELPF